MRMSHVDHISYIDNLSNNCLDYVNRSAAPCESSNANLDETLFRNVTHHELNNMVFQPTSSASAAPSYIVSEDSNASNAGSEEVRLYLQKLKLKDLQKEI